MVVCPVEAILIGDIGDPASKVAQTVNRQAVTVRRPEKDTQPKLFYTGAHQATLDPLAARQPDGGIFAWAMQSDLPGTINSGATGPATSSAAALVSYDVPHSMPWDWRVSLYTWTKGLASGGYLLAAVLVLAGVLAPDGVLWRWATPVAALVFLGLTGAILIWDLEHPARFLYIFTRPQWRSWLVRGGLIITAYGAVLAVHMLATLLDASALRTGITALGIPLAVLAAAYTAFLFAQAKARDLWQSPLLPVHMVVQAGVAGAAALLVLAAWLEPSATAALEIVLAGAAATHLLLMAGEVTLPHVTAHARAATHAMVAGRYRPFFWVGAVLVLAAATAPWIGVVAAPLALVGLLAHEHAYVQAGQSVLLA